MSMIVVCVVCNGKGHIVTGHTSVCCMDGKPTPNHGEREQWLTRRCEECRPTYVPNLEICPQCRGTQFLEVPEPKKAQ